MRPLYHWAIPANWLRGWESNPLLKGYGPSVQPVHFPTELVGVGGVEPPTTGSQNRCAATALHADRDLGLREQPQLTRFVKSLSNYLPYFGPRGHA